MRKLLQKFEHFFKKTISAGLASSIVMASSLSISYATPREVFSDRYAAIVIDANSGKTLFNANANAQRYPASLTKMMTLYLLYEAMDSGRVNPNTPIPISEYAASRPPTKLGLKPHDTIPAEAAAKALITKSANDVAVAVAEYLGGSEKHFAQIMTAKAHQLGMMNTHFANASGLPDVQNYSTARDLATLSLALRDHFPQKYKWFKTLSFRFRGREIRTHNHLVQHMKGVDGIKTGYTQMSGANLASSMHMSGRNIVAVVMGGRTAKLRDTHMAELLHRYLPKASKRKTRPIIMASASYSLNAFAPPPIPRAKEGTSAFSSLGLASTLYKNNANVTRIPVPTLKTPLNFPSPTITALADEEIIEKNPAKDAIAALLASDKNSLFIKRPLPNKTERSKDDKQMAFNKKASSKWMIQIGTSDSKAKAQSLLSKAQRLVPKLALDAEPQTIYVKNADKAYYRARFFVKNSRHAKNLCQSLKHKKIACYVIQSS